MAVKNAHAVALGRLGGKKGGSARAKSLSRVYREYYARLAGASRARLVGQKLSEPAQALLDLYDAFNKWTDRDKPPPEGLFFAGLATEAIEKDDYRTRIEAYFEADGAGRYPTRQSRPPRALVLPLSNPPTREEKKVSRAAMTEAVGKGLLKRGRCRRCGAPPEKGRPTHGHHMDYRLPFVIVWLCPTCHLSHYHGRFSLTAQAV